MKLFSKEVKDMRELNEVFDKNDVEYEILENDESIEIE